MLFRSRDYSMGLVILLAAFLVLTALFVIARAALRAHRTFGGTRIITCPENRRRAAGEVDIRAVTLGLSFPRLLLYVPWLAGEIIKATLDVARRIVSLGPPPIAPRIIRVRASQESELAQVIYANSITLTPGTISIDVSDGEILVHALHADAARGVEEGSMDRRCAALEGKSS